MSRLRDWLADTLVTEVVPYSKLKWFFLFPAAIYGGWMFASSGSWLTAIQWDFWVYVGCWLLVKPAELLGEGITRCLLLVLP